MNRKLASIQRIEALDPIPGADKIECATILGWHCVVAKGEFFVGDKTVFYEIDSMLPVKPEYEFMAGRKYRVKTIRLRKQISQGLAIPLNKIHYVTLHRCKVGDDVTDRLGVVKHEPPTVGNRGTKPPKTWWSEIVYRVKSWFGMVPPLEYGWPSFLQQTDETRIQSAPGYLSRHEGEPHYCTEKLDGCSCTIFLRRGRFGVCSRNTEVGTKRFYKDQRKNFWPIVRKLKIEESMRRIGRNLAIQGEVIGPDCNGGKYNIPECRLYVYTVFDLDTNKRVDFVDALEIATDMGLDWVPLVGNPQPLHSTVDGLVAASTGKSVITTGAKGYKAIGREGLVYRAMVDTGDRDTGHASFKVINPEFLLKHADDEDVGEAA